MIYTRYYEHIQYIFVPRKTFAMYVMIFCLLCMFMIFMYWLQNEFRSRSQYIKKNEHSARNKDKI